MKNAIAAEFLKFRRSGALMLAAAASFLPPIVKCLRLAFGSPDQAAAWQDYLASGQELTVFGLLIAVMLLSSHVFTMEYKYNTAAVIFTSGERRYALFTAKTIVLCAFIVLLLVISSVSQLLFGALAIRRAPPKELLEKFFLVMGWYAFSYFTIAVLVSLPAVLTKRFVLSSVITLGYYILIFPFHTKDPYVCPFMTPTVIAAKIYGSGDYIFAFSYDHLSGGALSAAVFLAAVAGAAFIGGILAYRKSDAVR